MCKDCEEKQLALANVIPDIELLGDRVWVKLEQVKSHTTTESGIVIPLNELTETDGGRVTTRASNRKHLSRGVIIKMSAKAKELLPNLGEGDKVYVNDRVVHKDYQFFPVRNQLVQEFEGDVVISTNHIEAKIN